MSADEWQAGEVPAPAGQPPQYGRVRVFPQYTFPVHQPGPGGAGLNQTITVVDWHKQGAGWAEAEARRQVGAALGGPPNEDGPAGGAWWMGQGSREQYRWQPLKGTPRGALPVNPDEQPAWQPEPRETAIPAGETGPETGLPRADPYADQAKQPAGKPTWATPARERRRENRPEDIRPEDPAAGETRVGPGGETITPEARAQLVAEAAAAGVPFALAPSDLEVGDRVRDNGRGELATVAEVSDGRVVLDYGRELTPGVPGSQRSNLGADVLLSGAVQRIPLDATRASLEELFPPAEQAERYQARRAHHEEQRGTGRRARNGYRKHKAGCPTCTDIDAGGDGTGRPLRVVETPPAADGSSAGRRFTYAGGVGGGRGGTAAGDVGAIRHSAWEAAMDAVRDHAGTWTIPDDGTGVLDTDAYLASIGGYVGALGGVLEQLAERLGGGQTPIAPVVGEALADFAVALGVMSEEAEAVYQQWAGNEDNAHDLRRARGEIPGAELFNVA
jgi:hypothetical protein